MSLSLWSLTSVSINTALHKVGCVFLKAHFCFQCARLFETVETTCVTTLSQHKSLNWAEMFVFGLLPLFSLTFHVNCHQRKSLYSSSWVAVSLLLNTWCGWEQLDYRDHHPCYTSWINRWRAAAWCRKNHVLLHKTDTIWILIQRVGLALSGGAVVAMPMTSSSN